MSRAVLSLGANLGDRLAALQAAVDALARQVDVVGISPVYETAPVGYADQPDFLNAVVVVDTTLPPPDLLAVAQEIERAAGRTAGKRWGPRVLDIDIVTYDALVSDDPDVTLPHPRAYQRAFVVRPWLDVDPSAALPGGVGFAPAGDVRRRDDLVLHGPA